MCVCVCVCVHGSQERYILPSPRPLSCRDFEISSSSSPSIFSLGIRSQGSRNKPHAQTESTLSTLPPVRPSHYLPRYKKKHTTARACTLDPFVFYIHHQNFFTPSLHFTSPHRHFFTSLHFISLHFTLTTNYNHPTTMHPSFKAATSTTAAVRAAAATATTLSSYTARTSRLTAAGLAACRNPPPPPHAPRTSLPPFRAPPLTPVFEIRSRSYSSTSRSSGGPRKGSSSSSSSNTDPNGPQYKAAERK